MEIEAEGSGDEEDHEEVEVNLDTDDEDQHSEYSNEERRPLKRLRKSIPLEEERIEPPSPSEPRQEPPEPEVDEENLPEDIWEWLKAVALLHWPGEDIMSQEGRRAVKTIADIDREWQQCISAENPDPLKIYGRYFADLVGEDGDPTQCIPEIENRTGTDIQQLSISIAFLEHLLPGIASSLQKCDLYGRPLVDVTANIPDMQNEEREEGNRAEPDEGGDEAGHRRLKRMRLLLRNMVGRSISLLRGVGADLLHHTRVQAALGRYLEQADDISCPFDWASSIGHTYDPNEIPNAIQAVIRMAHELFMMKRLVVMPGTDKVFYPIYADGNFVHAYRYFQPMERVLQMFARADYHPYPDKNYNPFASLLQAQAKSFSSIVKWMIGDYDSYGAYKPDRYTFAFANGRYLVDKNAFVSHAAGAGIGDRIAVNYFHGMNFDPYYTRLSYDELPTPAFDKILSTQGYDAEQILFIAALLIGRTLRPLGTDNFNIFLYPHGLAGVGKSILLKILIYIHSLENCFMLSNNPESNFPLAGSENAHVMIISEMTETFSLPQSDFQQMIVGDPVSIKRKYKDATGVGKWRIPFVGAGNHRCFGLKARPPYRDNKGSLGRRVLGVPMMRPLPSNSMNTNLERELEKELPALLAKSNRRYLELLRDVGHSEIWSWLARHPEIGKPFLEDRKIRETVWNPAKSFVDECPEIEMPPDNLRHELSEEDINAKYFCSWSSLKEVYDNWAKENSVNMSLREAMDGGLAQLGITWARREWPPRDSEAAVLHPPSRNRWIFGIRVCQNQEGSVAPARRGGGADNLFRSMQALSSDQAS